MEKEQIEIKIEEELETKKIQWKKIFKIFFKIIGKGLYFMIIKPSIYFLKKALKDFESVKDLKYVLLAILYISPLFIVVELFNYIKGM